MSTRVGPRAGSSSWGLRRAAVATVLAVVSVSSQPISADAVTVRPMTLNYNKIVNGDYVMVGNGVLQCD